MKTRFSNICLMIISALTFAVATELFLTTTPARAMVQCTGAIVGKIVDEKGNYWGRNTCENYPYSSNIELDFSGGDTYFHGCSDGPYYWTDETACGQYTLTLTPPEGYRCKKWTLTYVNTSIKREGPGCTATIATTKGNPIQTGDWNNLHTSLWFHIEPETQVDIPDTAVNFNCDFDDTLVCDSTNGNFVEPVDSQGVVFTGGKHGKAILNYGPLAYETMNHFNPNKGSIQMWVKPDWDGNDNERHFFISYYADKNNYLSIEKSEDNLLKFVVTSPPGDTPQYKWNPNLLWHSVSYDVSDWKAGEWHHIKMIWDQTLNNYYPDPTRTYGEIKGYVDGQLVGITTDVWNHLNSADSFHVGSFTRGYWHANAAIDELEITHLTQSNIPDKTCGNEICEVGENVNLCPSDCNQFSIPPDGINSVDTDYDIGVFVMPGFSDTRDDGAYPFSTKSIQERWDTDNMRSATPVLELGEGAHHQPMKSVLGWYDDSNPVFWDWLIKWELEHGVNLFIFDWYRENDRMYFQDSLEKGFMDSKFFNEAKFAIMWTNGSAAMNMEYLNEDKFRDMIYYMGNKYFSKDNYYRINGKPVLFLWSPSAIFYNLGGAEKTRILLDRMRQWSQEQGYNGLYVIAMGSDGNSQDERGNWDYSNFVEAYKDMGIDGITDYGSAGYDDMDNYIDLNNRRIYYEPYEQLIEPAKQRYAQIKRLIDSYDSRMEYFPTLISGHDWTPRRSFMDTKVRTYSSAELFGQTVRNAKDFIDNYDIQPKLITINALSEFSEGGVLQPMEHTDFSYLEAVRSALGIDICTDTDLICDGSTNLLDLLDWRRAQVIGETSTQPTGILGYLQVLRGWLRN